MQQARTFFAAFGTCQALLGLGTTRECLALLAAVIGLTLGLVWINVQLNAWNNELYNAIQDKKLDDFYRLLGRFTLLAFAFIVAAVRSTSAADAANRMAHLAQRAPPRGLARRPRLLPPATARSGNLDARHGDNPDQRIADDLRISRHHAFSLGLSRPVTLFRLSQSCGRLGARSGFAGTDWSIPGYMVWLLAVRAWAPGSPTDRPAADRPGLQPAALRGRLPFSLVRLRETSEESR